MSSLRKKLLRDLVAMRGQATAIGLVIAAGIAVFVMSLSALDSLQSSKDAYYSQYRFAEVFGQLKRAPITLAKRIGEIPGVAKTQTRIVFDVTLDMDEIDEPVVGRLISVPDYHEPKLNDIHLRRGRMIQPGREGEVVVGESFAQANHIQPGDQLSAIINGRKKRLTIVGIVLSPEYIIQIKAGSMMPDDKRFGVFWMSERQLAAAFDMEGAFNDVSLTLMHGASVEEAKRRLDILLEPYGGLASYSRDKHISHQYISDEIRQLQSTAVISPIIFLSVAAFLLNVVMNRLVGTQRELIAALKAFGYTKWQVASHYFQIVLCITMLGVLVGIGTGIWMGDGLTAMYAKFYRFPIFSFQFNWAAITWSLLIAGIVAVLSTYRAVRRATNLPPAEAMRPEPPAQYRPTILDKMGIGAIFSQAFRMIVRHLERQPIKAFFSTLGISLSVAVLVLGSFSLDAIDYIINFQFRLAQRQDVSVTFNETVSPEAVHEIAKLPGVIQSEPFRAVSTRLRSQHRSRRVGILGLKKNNSLFRLLDVNRNAVSMPDEGLLLSAKLAQLLELEVGDFVTVEVLEEKRPIRNVKVAAIITEFGGLNAYMNINALNRLMRETKVISGAHLLIDQSQANQLYFELKNTPSVSSVNLKSVMLASFEDTIAENILKIRMFNIIFAIVIAFGVVYNSARISLSERSRDLATLRVIGFTNREVSAILLGELAILTAFAIPLGCLLGYYFAALVTLGLDTELYRIPLIINRSTYMFATIVVAIAALVSGLVVRHRINSLDLVSVLKTKE